MKENIRITLLCIIAGTLLWNTFKRGKSPESEVKSNIYDSIVGMVKKDMEAQLNNQDAKIAALLRNDSIIASKIPEINDRINKIPVRINSLPDDELWREISKAYPPN